MHTQAIAVIDEEPIKARINDTLVRLETNEAIAEFYCELRAQVALRRAQLEMEMLFETNFMRAAEQLFTTRMDDSKSKRLAATSYDITLESKTEKEYDAEELLLDLKRLLPETEYAKAVFVTQKTSTNGTEINKLARAYGEESNVAKVIAFHTRISPIGRPKLKIEPKDSKK